MKSLILPDDRLNIENLLLQYKKNVPEGLSTIIKVLSTKNNQITMT